VQTKDKHSTLTTVCTLYVTVSKYIQCETKNPPGFFSDIFFQNGWEFLVQILRAYFSFLSTLDYKFVFS